MLSQYRRTANTSFLSALLFASWCNMGCGYFGTNQAGHPPFGDEPREPLNCKPHVPDGCGPRGVLSAIVPECPLNLVCFTSACNAHDTCYRTCGASQEVCDDNFFIDLNAICTDRIGDDDPRIQHCRLLASVYTAAVVNFGLGAYQGSQYIACACDGKTSTDPTLAQLRYVPIRPAFDDEDGDLLPDHWETEVGLDPTDASDTWLDHDGDGLTALEEFAHDTDPFDVDSDGDGVDDGTEAAAAQP
jgi:Group XII secretory phospholipase A2 precursor (PLA2G12)